MKTMDWWIETSQKWIIKAHGDDNYPEFVTKDFGELLRHEIYEKNMPFWALAEHWNISLSVLGELIADHCRRLEEGE